MQLGRRIFPYPVINQLKSINGYKNSIFNLKYDELVISNDCIILKNAYYKLNNNEIIDLLKNNKAECVVIFENSDTFFKKITKITDEKTDIIIPARNVSGVLEISSFIYLKQNINSFLSNDFLDDYKGFSFDLTVGDILAFDDGFKIKINYEESNDKKNSSIFLVVKSENEYPSLNIGPDKIIVQLPSISFDLYYQLKNNENFSNVFMTMLASHALSIAIEKIKEDSIDDAKIKYSWFSTVAKSYKKIYNNEINDENIKNLDSFEISFKMLGNSLVKAIDEIYTINNTTMGEIQDDD